MTRTTQVVAPQKMGAAHQQMTLSPGGKGLPQTASRLAQTAIMPWQSRMLKLMASGVLQRKATVNQPGDVFEQEADRVADSVTRRPDPGAAPQPVTSVGPVPGLQRCSCGPSSGGGGECEECKAKSMHMKEGSAGSLTAASWGATAPPIVHDVLRSPGQPLDATTRSFMEPRFGRDFSGVRAHTDSEAAKSAGAVNALAYTVGRDVVFGSGQYAQRTTAGLRLIAHELTHVMQQTSSPARVNQLMRVPHQGDIKTEPPRYSYSTNCGWIDWGHTIPGLARDLIARVREASMRLKRAEAKLEASDAPELVKEAKCHSEYEPREESQSASEQPVWHTTTRPGGTIEIQLGGFGVDSSDATKFARFVPVIAKLHSDHERLRKAKVTMEISGFTDCVGSYRENVRLRVDRSTEMLLLLLGAGKSTARVVLRGSDQFLATNATREGRRRNRGLLIRLVPTIQPETVVTPPMQSGGFGIVAHRATLTTKINRSLTEAEVLSVAFSIFARLSIAFESAQKEPKLVDRFVKSSFSEEDLPSNHISFYRAAKGYSREEVEKLCDAWDARRSLKKFEGYKFQRNTTFFPVNLPPGGKWPAEFSTISAVKPDAEGLYEIVEMLLQGASDVPLGQGARQCIREGKEVPCPKD